MSNKKQFVVASERLRKPRLIASERSRKLCLIDLGGSAVCPDGIDVEFLKQFREFIKRKIEEGYRFVIVVGGGGICRQYQKAASEVVDIEDKEKDWVGIFATRLNARLLQAIFCDVAYPDLFDERFKMKSFRRPSGEISSFGSFEIKELGEYQVIIASGWKPGWSTDYVAVQIAVDFKIDTVVNLGKPDYIYKRSLRERPLTIKRSLRERSLTIKRSLRERPAHNTADPGKDAGAKPIKKLSWSDYWKMAPSKWTPGLNFPLDPIAAKLAEKENIKIIIAGAKDLDNLEKILEEKEFKGTALE
jgi:uridylate kinase